MNGIAGRMIQQATPVATCLAADRMACETTDEGLRSVTSETAPQTMYDTTMYAAPRIAIRTVRQGLRPTMSETARRTKDQTTAQTTSQTVRRAIPWAGVSFASLKPKASSHNQTNREAVSGQYYSVVGSAPRSATTRRSPNLTIRSRRALPPPSNRVALCPT